MTLLLSWKSELSQFAGRPVARGNTQRCILMGLLGFVNLSYLPDRFIDRWQLINPNRPG